MSEYSGERRFFVGLEGLRGLAACMVLVFHATWSHSFRDLPIFMNSWQFVDLFFVLSGFVIANRYIGRMEAKTDRTSYAIARVCRIYPLHLFYLAIFVLLHVVVSQLSASGLVSGKMTETNQPFWQHLFGHVFLLHSTGVTPNNAFNLPSWSISAEAVAYLFFFITSVIGLTSRLRPLLWLGLAAVFGLLLTQLSKEDALDSTSQFGALRALFGFSLGVATQGLCESLFKSGKLSDHPLKLLTLQVLGFALVIWILWVGVTGNPVTFLAPFIFALFIFSLAIHEKGPFNSVLTSTPFRFLGAVSYGVYMIHLLIIVVLKNVVDILGFVEGQNGLDDIVSPMVGNVMVLIVLGGSLIGAWIVNKIIEKPMIKWGKMQSKRLTEKAVSAS